MAKKKRMSAMRWYNRKHLSVGVKNAVRFARRGLCEQAHEIYRALVVSPGNKEIKPATWSRIKKEIRACDRRQR
jgi:nitrate reductase beta subunit